MTYWKQNKWNKTVNKQRQTFVPKQPFLRNVALGVMLAMPVMAGMANALELIVDGEQREKLGIKVQTLAKSSQQAITMLSLRTAFSPDGEWVIKTPVSGILHRTFVQEGDKVLAGQELVSIRSAEVVQLQRDFLRASSQLRMQLATSKREKLLFDAGSISNKRWQETRFNTDNARAEYSALKAELLLVGFTDDSVAELKRGMTISPEFSLRAPVNALVTERAATLGDHLEGSELLLRLGEPNKLVLEGQLSSTAAQSLTKGSRIKANNGPGQAVIVFVSNVIDRQTQTVHVRAEPMSKNGLIAGQLSQWAVQSNGQELTVPASAIVKLDGSDVIYVQTDKGFEARPVQARSSSSGAWVIESGVQVGDAVAIKGTAVLKGMSMGMGGGEE